MRCKINHSSVCEKGFVRQINQDSVYAFSDGYNGVFCVADGMGGYSKGEVASSTIISEIKKAWYKIVYTDQKYSFRDSFGYFEKAIDFANKKIYECYNIDSICGSTVSLLMIYDSCYGIINVGDSRVYTFKNKRLVQMTEDDVWENLPEQNGIDKKILSMSIKYGKLTNSVGTSEKLLKKYSISPILGHMNFLLCSDGLYKCCDEKRMNTLIEQNRSNPKSVVATLTNEVYLRGATDNFSIIYLCI